MNTRNNWLSTARWGLMFHYLDKPASSNVSSPTPPADWNRRVDSFDVPLFASQVRASGAGYIIFTLGQNTGHFCAPNAVYDEIVGSGESRLAKRDLIAEIARELGPDIKTIAYLPSHAPANHLEAVMAMRLTPAWDPSAWGLSRSWGPEQNEDDQLSAFQRNWENVVAYWGAKWGDLVSGWWIDGCYFADRMYKSAEGPNGDSFAAALRTGNQGRMLAFNNGTATPFCRVLNDQDYAAGEVSNKLPVNDTWTPLEPTVEGMQNHLLSFLGEYWGRGPCRFTDALAAGYTRYLWDRGIPMTWDVPIENHGAIADGHRRQLDAIGQMVAG